ncbi:MAG: DNA methyltransferase, partial [Candidatus Thorarchaeota archaeon]
GSGTTLLAAEKLKRRWIGCDISEYSIYLTRKRILNYHNDGQILYLFDLFTHLDTEKSKLIDSGFFQKDLSLKRKK